MIKTTKETHKQDEAFKGNVTFDSYDNVYANVDGEMKSLPDYIDSRGSVPDNLVTTDTNQNITGTKTFKSNILLQYNKYISMDNSDTVGASWINFYQYSFSNIACAKRFSSSDIHYVIFNQSNYCFITLKESNYTEETRLLWGYDWNGNINVTKKDVNWIFRHTSTNNENLFVASTKEINATTALALTNISGHRYTGTISTSNKVECIVDIDGTYTANFNIAKGMKTAFLMVYGTSSSDVATCFATMDSSGLVTIDLDNVSLSSFTPTCKYIIYN